MTDLNISPCSSQNLGLQRLESLEIPDTSKCPTSPVEIERPQDESKDLKKTEVIKHLVICDSCKINEAVNFCLECSFNYCPTCLVFHGRIPATSGHRLEPQRDQIKVNRCKEHSTMKKFYCKSCKILICSQCHSMHQEEPEMMEMTEYFDSVKVTLEQNLKAKEDRIEIILSNVKNICDEKDKKALSASNLKNEIQKRGQDLKNLIDVITMEKQKRVDKELERQCTEADDVLKELNDSEKQLKAEVEALKEQLNNMTFENVPEIFPEMADKDENIPSYSESFEVSFHFSDSEELIKLRKMFGDVMKVQNVRLVKKIQFPSRREIKTFASSEDGVYVGWMDGSIAKVKKVFPCPEWNVELSGYKIKDLLRSIYDVLIFNNKLLVSGNLQSDSKANGIVIIPCGQNGYPQLEYQDQKAGTWKMSKISNDKFLVTTDYSVTSLSFYQGSYIEVRETLDFHFRITDALYVNDDRYAVVSSKKVFVVNSNGEQLFTFSPLDNLNPHFTCLTRDKRGNIYVYNLHDDKTYILNLNLELKAVCSLNKSLNKISFDEHRNCLTAFGSFNMLYMYEF